MDPNDEYDIEDSYVKCKKEALNRIKLTMENLLPADIRKGLEDYRFMVTDIEETVDAIIEKLIELIERDKKFDLPAELFEAKTNLERFDLALRKCLNSKVKELKSLFDFEYEAEFIPQSEEPWKGGTYNDTSDQASATALKLFEGDEEDKVHMRWRQIALNLRKPKKGKYSESLQELLRETEIVWEPQKIIIGPATKNRQLPCFIPICNLNNIQDDDLVVTKKIKVRIKEATEIPPVTSNTQLFFKQQIKSKTYFQSLNLLTEHHKQSDLLLKSLSQLVNEYPMVKNTKTNRKIKHIKRDLKELMRDIDKDFHSLYAHAGINDIAKVSMPKSEHYYERQYGFVEEKELENLISKYVTENRLVKNIIMKQFETNK